MPGLRTVAFGVHRKRKAGIGVHHRPGNLADSRLHSPAGYTMVELAMALTLISITSAVAVTRLRPALEHGKVNAAASVLAADLHYAQMVAARQRRPVIVIVIPATRQYVIRDRPTDGTVFRTRLLGQESEYALDELSSTVSGMEVFPTGTTRAGTTFTVGMGGYRRQVAFTRAGQIRVLSGS